VVGAGPRRAGCSASLIESTRERVSLSTLIRDHHWSYISREYRTVAFWHSRGWSGAGLLADWHVRGVRAQERCAVPMRRAVGRWRAAALVGGASGCAAAYVQEQTRRCQALLDAAAESRWGQTHAQRHTEAEAEAEPEQDQELVAQLAGLERRLAAIEVYLLGPAPRGRHAEGRGASDRGRCAILISIPINST
jgi:hypothetical protein